MMYRIECEPASHAECACCGNTVTNLTRFVRRDGNDEAAYLARFTLVHEPPWVDVLVGIGPWGEGTGPADREAFFLRIWLQEQVPTISFFDHAESPWTDSALMGMPLSREEALASARKNDVFELTNQMLAQDPEIIDWVATCKKD